MARAAPIITALNAGELSPTLDGRVDLAKYAAGAKRMENFLPLVQGPAQRRGGTRFVSPVKDSSKRTWGVKFEFSATHAFVLEFGDEYVRFFTQRGQLLVDNVDAWDSGTTYQVGDLVAFSGVNYYCIATNANQQPPNATYWYPLEGEIYEIPSPYPLADLTTPDGTCALKVVQSGDVLYIAHVSGAYPPRKLTRHADTRWIFSEYVPNQGPFLESHTGSTTLTASGVGGSVTITASAPVFAATDVGRLVRIEANNPDDDTIRPWEQEVAYTTGTIVRYDGKYYVAQNDGTSGTNPPTHTHGVAYDGKNGVAWLYRDAGYGVARITAVTSSTSVMATVVQDRDNGLNFLPHGMPTTRWALGAWSGTTGYPRYVAFWSDRLWWFGKSIVWRIWGSVPHDYENMSPDFFGELRADSAIARQLQAQDVNDVAWVAGADRLLIGTGGGEFVVGPITTTEPLGPANIQVVRQSAKRSRAVEPVAVGAAICYVQRAGRKLLSAAYSLDAEKYISTDLAVLADRITRSGIVHMAYQGEPYSIIWCVLSNGKLVGFTYDREQDVTGWHRHLLGGNGAVEWVVSIPTPDGSREELWLCVRRTINGETRRYIEYLERPWEGPDEDGTAGDDKADAFYVDSGLTYNGAPTTTLSGLDHLEGETVQILADGAVQPDKVVSGGAITLEHAASKVHVGLKFVSRLVPMRLEAGAQDGTAQGKIKRVHSVTVRFLDTLGGKIGRYGSALDELSLRSPATPMGHPEQIRSGDVQVDFGGDYDRDALIEIVQDQPLPMTVVAVMPRLRTYD